MRCDEIMKRNVECLSETDDCQTAAKRMRDANIGFMPVCDEQKKPVGTVTDRDLALRVCADDRQSSKMRIRDVMTREVVSCKATDDLSQAEQLMGRNHKSRIMLTDRTGLLVGVISLSDIAEHDRKDGRAAELMRAVSQRELRA